MDIRELAARFLENKPLIQEEFEKLYNFINDRLPGWMRSYYADAFQTVALRLLTKKEKILWRDSISYLVTAIKNECINQQRVNAKYTGLLNSDIPSPVVVAESKEKSIIDRLHMQLIKLKEADLQLLVQLYWLDESRQQLSKYLNISINTFRQRVFRIITGLRIVMAH